MISARAKAGTHDGRTLALDEAREQTMPWKQWGPYLSERQWGTVREDYSENGDAWNYFSHDQARSRAYRWGEDGIAGISDQKQRLCFAVALWNGKDPILKERLFGLTNSEGNHGEDVKEYYFYLDSTPTHSYMKYLYKYPQSAFPYEDLVETNRHRGKEELEYELLDTGVFDQDRYFDVFVEYAKESPRDLLIRISIHNRGPLIRPGSMSCQPSGSAMNGPGLREPRGLGCVSLREMRPARRSPRNIPSWAFSTCIVMGMSRSFSPRTKPTRSGIRRPQSRIHMSRMASITMSYWVSKTQ